MCAVTWIVNHSVSRWGGKNVDRDRFSSLFQWGDLVEEVLLRDNPCGIRMGGDELMFPFNYQEF
jgi:hypothetical protein